MEITLFFLLTSRCYLVLEPDLLWHSVVVYIDDSCSQWSDAYSSVGIRPREHPGSK
jgi:hypothetical protein